MRHHGTHSTRVTYVTHSILHTAASSTMPSGVSSAVFSTISSTVLFTKSSTKSSSNLPPPTSVHRPFLRSLSTLDGHISCYHSLIIGLILSLLKGSICQIFHFGKSQVQASHNSTVRKAALTPKARVMCVNYF